MVPKSVNAVVAMFKTERTIHFLNRLPTGFEFEHREYNTGVTFHTAMDVSVAAGMTPDIYTADVVMSVLNPDLMMVKCASAWRVVCCTKGANAAMLTLHAKHTIQFVDWSPSSEKHSPPWTAGPHRSSPH